MYRDLTNTACKLHYYEKQKLHEYGMLLLIEGIISKYNDTL
jgi:hypothetical protein